MTFPQSNEEQDISVQRHKYVRRFEVSGNHIEVRVPSNRGRAVRLATPPMSPRAQRQRNYRDHHTRGHIRDVDTTVLGWRTRKVHSKTFISPPNPLEVTGNSHQWVPLDYANMNARQYSRPTTRDVSGAQGPHRCPSS